MYTFNRFVFRQRKMYETALNEIKNGKKKCHWMLYIFPQMRGVGTSYKSSVFSLDGVEEARAYLAHPLLGQRLIECTRALLAHKDKSAEEIFGDIDANKLRSCMTLFSEACISRSVFDDVLDLFFDGKKDEKTVRLLYGDRVVGKILPPFES